MCSIGSRYWILNVTSCLKIYDRRKQVLNFLKFNRIGNAWIIDNSALSSVLHFYFPISCHTLSNESENQDSKGEASSFFLLFLRFLSSDKVLSLVVHEIARQSNTQPVAPTASGQLEMDRSGQNWYLLVRSYKVDKQCSAIFTRFKHRDTLDVRSILDIQ